MIHEIPFNKPSTVGNEFKYIRKAIHAGHISDDGMFTKKCHAFFEETLDIPNALLTTSCTHALEMVAILCSIFKLEIKLFSPHSP